MFKKKKKNVKAEENLKNIHTILYINKVCKFWFVFKLILKQLFHTNHKCFFLKQYAINDRIINRKINLLASSV